MQKPSEAALGTDGLPKGNKLPAGRPGLLTQESARRERPPPGSACHVSRPGWAGLRSAAACRWSPSSGQGAGRRSRTAGARASVPGQEQSVRTRPVNRAHGATRGGDSAPCEVHPCPAAACTLPPPAPSPNYGWAPTRPSHPAAPARRPAHPTGTEPAGAQHQQPHPIQPPAGIRAAARLTLTWGPSRVSAWQPKSGGQGGHGAKTTTRIRRGSCRKELACTRPRLQDGHRRRMPLRLPRRPRAAPPRPTRGNPAPRLNLSVLVQRSFCRPRQGAAPCGSFLQWDCPPLPSAPPTRENGTLLLDVAHFSVSRPPTGLEMSQPRSSPVPTSRQDLALVTEDLS